MKLFVCLTFFLSAEYWTLGTARAKDLGTHGVIYPIEEEDPIVLIQSKLKRMEENGELERRYQELQNKTKAAIERPKLVKGIAKARARRVFYYDPTYIVTRDIKDHMGQAFYKKGTKVNPLETVNLSQELLFFDGDDEGQVAFAKKKVKDNLVKLILVNGAPLALSEALKIPVYFDQGGLLAKKLGINYVPALVTQEKKKLSIEEIFLPSLKSESKEGKNK